MTLIDECIKIYQKFDCNGCYDKQATYMRGEESYVDTVNDLVSAPELVTAPYLFSWQYSPVTASTMQRTCSSHPEIKNSME